MHMMALAIPLVSIVLGIGIAFAAMYLDHQKKRLLFEERRLMIERGQTPPPLPSLKRHCRTPQESLRRGIVLLCLAAGFGAAFYIVHASDLEGAPHWGFGIAAALVGSLGLGNLIYYLVVRGRSPQEPVA